MKVILKNIGILREANVEIKGLTIIAGENNTGKSTVGKALFVLFNTLNHLDKHIIETKHELIRRSIGQMFDKDPNFEYLDHLELDGEIADLFLFNKRNDVLSIKEALLKLVKSSEVHISDEDFSELLQRVTNILLYREEDIKKKSVESSVKEEFGQIVNNFCHLEESAEIKLKIRNDVTIVKFDNNTLVALENTRNLQYQPFYFDDESTVALDACARNPLKLNNFSDKAQKVVARLFINPETTPAAIIQQELVKQTLEPVVNRFRELCGGRLERRGRGLVFLQDEKNIRLPINNLSAGLKVFLMLQELILNGSLIEQGTVILDEPEIHLHPLWQVKLAELVVLLQKALKLHILIMTHSPYFVGALDIYSKKYGVIDDNRYYFVERREDGGVVRDVTQHLAVIYDSLAQPYQTIEDEAMELENAGA